MKSLKVISDTAATFSKFLKLRNVKFIQNGMPRSWDYISSKDSVTALVFDKKNQEFVCVQQFRPAMFFGASEMSKETIKNPNMGYCYELCAGLLDRPNRSKEQAVCDEIQEELGYVVKPEDLEFVGRTPGAVGMSGSRMYMYYVEVTPDQKKFQGGGLKEEGEQISEYRVPLSEMDAFLADYEQEKSASIMMGMYWWRHLRGKNYPVGKFTKWHVC
ncbi:uncharacterized protein [Blastocystis hominis]|uniref:Nudix hydrolase domain-containing protein n=1 Tax=Blastocystis hominis TaxID=12968 RepID=D8M8V6_BLAHO|nr:uncharacterized protein [Blastocystis hominis]CBK24495.2 unnamed protein product [Blastocystis hominis]|eukprot:XP_012898543.1 uncharacterized protein [Blastocystis hominis]